MPGWGVAAKTAGRIAKTTAQAKVRQVTSPAAIGQRIGQSLGRNAYTPGRGFNNTGTSWWNASTLSPRQDWRQIADLTVQRGTGQWMLPGKPTLAKGVHGLNTLLQQTPQRTPSVTTTAAPTTTTLPEYGRRFHFLQHARLIPQPSGEIGTQTAIGAGHPGSEMRFGTERRQVGTGGLSNVRPEDEIQAAGVVPGRNQSFALGTRQPLMLMPGPQQRTQRRPAE